MARAKAKEREDSRPIIRTKLSLSSKLFYVICYTVVAVVAIICLVPFIIIISSSFTGEDYLRHHGYGFLIHEFSTSAYELIFKDVATIDRSFGVSILITVVGTVLGTLMTALAAYVISSKDFKYRNQVSFFFYFTTLFNGGMVCTYIFYIQYFHLKDSLGALILPGLFQVFYMLVMRSYVSEIPMALIESAKIDGAGEWTIFFKIILPLLKAGLATIAMFLALGYWNDWYNAMLYINTEEKYPLQYLLYNMLQQSQAMARVAASAGIPVADMTSNSLKMAMAVVATVPVLVVYPFVQRYFVAGITIGSVKG